MVVVRWLYHSLVADYHQAQDLAERLEEKELFRHGSKAVTVRSYANIAIIKYWGKKQEKEMVPATSSISLTLENMYTETTLSPLPADARTDEFYINWSVAKRS